MSKFLSVCAKDNDGKLDVDECRWQNNHLHSPALFLSLFLSRSLINVSLFALTLVVFSLPLEYEEYGSISAEKGQIISNDDTHTFHFVSRSTHTNTLNERQVLLWRPDVMLSFTYCMSTTPRERAACSHCSGDGPPIPHRVLVPNPQGYSTNVAFIEDWQEQSCC